MMRKGLVSVVIEMSIHPGARENSNAMQPYEPCEILRLNATRRGVEVGTSPSSRDALGLGLNW